MFTKKKENPKEDNQAKKPQDRPQNIKPTEPQETQKQLELLQKEKDDLFAKLQRVAADYDNYQKRSSKQITETVAYEKDKIIKAFLPAMDDFERVMAHTDDATAFIKGVGIAYEHFKSVLRSLGVEQIDSQGENFNPAHHEAITHRNEQGQQDGIVLEELQKGYKVDGRVIRASRVIVNKVADTETKQNPKDTDQEEPETRDTQ